MGILSWPSPNGRSLPLAPYANATQRPFQGPTDSGPDILGSHHANTELTESFHVFDLNVAATDTFAFTDDSIPQEKENPQTFSGGEIHHHSEFPASSIPSDTANNHSIDMAYNRDISMETSIELPPFQQEEDFAPHLFLCRWRQIIAGSY